MYKSDWSTCFCYAGGVGGLDFGSGSGPIFVEEPFCYGFEDSILDCTSRHEVGVHQCDHSSDVGIRCQGLLVLILTLAWLDACGQSLYAVFQSGSLVFLRLSTLNLTTIRAHHHFSRFTRRVLLQIIRLLVRIIVHMHANQQTMYTVCLLLMSAWFFIRSANLQLFCPLGMLLPEEVKSIQIANLSTRKLFCHQLLFMFWYQCMPHASGYCMAKSHSCV